ncbi:MAG: Mov34/MPN/PAD-1 family protein [Phycisphaerales bacterium]|nr:Mov34/MPN/PAD-1 family protein [Phycisphaerales bacterium]
MQVIFSNRAYLSILAETSEKIKTETGGVFLGCYEKGNWYVVESIDPGPQSIFQAAYFEYDQKYTQHLINKIAQLYQAKLGLIGLWHRHPGSFDEFSSTDDGTNSDYAKLSPNGAVSVLVNLDPHFRVTPYHVAWPLRYAKITYQVGDDHIPGHLLQMKKEEQLLAYINGYMERPHSTNSQAARPKADFQRLLEGVKSKFKALPYVITAADMKLNEADKHRDILIDSLLDDISYFSEKRGLALNVEQGGGTLCLSHRGGNNVVTKVHFIYLPHKKQVVFSYGDNLYQYAPGFFAELLADYQPPDTAFKTELMRALGLGNKRQEG